MRATMKELLEAGVHFGHQTRRWNPKMAKYIFAERNGIYIIDLQKTLRMLQTACDQVQEIAAQGGTVLFVILQNLSFLNPNVQSSSFLNRKFTNFEFFKHCFTKTKNTARWPAAWTTGALSPGSPART